MIRLIEEFIINSTPSTNVIIDNGFLIRIRNTRDICTINKVGESGFELSAVIRSHEKRLRELGVNPCYRILHNKKYENLDVELMRSGYDIAFRGLVMGINITNMQKELFRFANLYEQGIQAYDGIDEQWLRDYRMVKDLDDDYGDILSDNLTSSVEEFMSFVLIQENRFLGMAYVTLINKYVIINDIFIQEKYRGLDYGKKILKAILAKGLQRNCEMVICDLRDDQISALHMFEKEGFKKIYSYQYRGKKL